MWPAHGHTPLQKRSMPVRDDPPPAYPFDASGHPKRYSGLSSVIASPGDQEVSFSEAAPWSGPHPYRETRNGSGQRPHSAGPHGRSAQGVPQGRMRPLSASAVRAGRNSHDVQTTVATPATSAWEDSGPRSVRQSSVTSLRPHSDAQKFSGGRRGI